MMGSQHRLPTAILVLALVIASPVLGKQCPTAPDPSPGPEVSIPPINYDVPAVPGTNQLPATFEEITDRENRYAWDVFAWQTFIALNWPAVDPQEQNGFLRGFPNLENPETINFANAGSYDGPLVWETFKEKREVFDSKAKTEKKARPTPWNADFSPKVIYNTAKFVSLDETVEVKAEALEGYDNKFYNSLPTVARVFRGTQPNIGDTQTPEGNAVRYEVKVNYDFYKYVVDNQLYFDPIAAARSRLRPPIQLPWRTSLPNPGVTYLTQKPTHTPYVEGYQVEKTIATYQSDAQRANANTAITPPRIGAIHIKAAWAPIGEHERKDFIARESVYFNNDKKKKETALFGLVGLHIIQRIKVQAPEGQLNKNPIGGTFIFSTWEHKDIRACVGGDGTQYTYTNYFEPPLSPGHIAEPPLDDPFYLYRLYPILDHTADVNAKVAQDLEARGSVWKNYRLVGTQFMPVDITTDGPIQNNRPNSTTAAVPNTTTNPNNPAVPFTVDGQKMKKPLGQPVYLSNLVIETNLGLQQFQGQPPGVTAVQQFGYHYDKESPPKSSGAVLSNLSSTAFVRTKDDIPFPGQTSPAQKSAEREQFGNMAYGYSPKNMGGCMGCHGVAQLNGFSFSFVLLGGQAGADPDSEKVFDDPLTSVDTKNIPMVVQGGQYYVQPTHLPQGRYLARSGTSAVLQTSSAPLTIRATDGRPTGTPFNFGDAVTLTDGSHYLTAHGCGQPDGPCSVTFADSMGDAAVWYLYDANDPTSTGLVTRIDQLSFRNATVDYPKVTFPKIPYGAFLSTYPTDKDRATTVNHASTGDASNELWTLNSP